MSTATVQVLTAEVRTLMVGSRQVTLSVYRQLDWVEDGDIEVFGHVCAPEKDDHLYAAEFVRVVGRHHTSGALVRSGRSPYIDIGPCNYCTKTCSRGKHNGRCIECEVTRCEACVRDNERGPAAYQEWLDLPLIVLAGLR